MAASEYLVTHNAEPARPGGRGPVIARSSATPDHEHDQWPDATDKEHGAHLRHRNEAMPCGHMLGDRCDDEGDFSTVKCNG